MTIPVSWRKSSRSTNSTNCVEVRNDLGAIRDSKNKNPDAPMLSLPREAVTAFVRSVS